MLVKWQDSAGCTGIVTVLDLEEAELTIAHAGDSRVIVYELCSEALDTNASPKVLWQSVDHESTERALGNRMRKEAVTPPPPTAEPEVNKISLSKGRSAVVIVSDGVLNAHETPGALMVATTVIYC